MKKGFTLIELLVVIAILAVLATAVVIILNPAELLKQGRDSTRLSDLAAMQSAIALYLADVASPDVDFGAPGVTCGAATPVASCSIAGATSPMTLACTVAGNNNTTVTGAGWVPIDFGAISSGSPLSRLPLDPTNTTTYFYAYGCNAAALTYEIDANLESVKFIPKEANTSDGGNNANWYEVGSSLVL